MYRSTSNSYIHHLIFITLCIKVENMDYYSQDCSNLYQDGAKRELNDPKDWVMCRSLPATPTRIIQSSSIYDVTPLRTKIGELCLKVFRSRNPKIIFPKTS